MFSNSVLGRQADEITVLGNAFLRKNRDKPFFLFLNYFDPHAPYQPPKELLTRFLDESAFDERTLSDPEASARYNLSLYDSEILFMDQEIGRLFDELKKLDLYEDSWIIVISDHGELLGEHELKGHGQTLYEPSVHCPMIIKWPDAWTERPSTEKPCQQVDIMPTIARRLHVEAGLHFEGQPLGEITHPTVCELFRNPGFAESKGPRFDRNLKAVYAGPYKMIVSTKEQDQDAGLFDLLKDPGELIDLTAEKPDVIKSLKILLERWSESLHNALPPKQIENVDLETQKQLEALGYGK
ncbi:MAG: sulfatase-like hydrolase/transferase [Planctomycetota bacterium]